MYMQPYLIDLSPFEQAAMLACASEWDPATALYSPQMMHKLLIQVSAEVVAAAAQLRTSEARPRKDPETEQLVLKAMGHSFLFTGEQLPESML